jgi:hypothetical protein
MHGGLEEAFEGLSVHLLVPDLWQQDAIRALRDGEDVIVAAPTGAGKTLVFESLVKEAKQIGPGKQAVYTVPTRALANDKWREWKRDGWHVGIATGDLAEDLDAPVLVATLETQRERFLSGDGPALLVIDEYQMIGDRRRGLHYELAVALAPPHTRLLLLSGSVANPKRVSEWLTRLGRSNRIVETKDRPVPLEEIPLDALPRLAPRKVRNFWQRLALSTLLSHYGPLLIFAPHRKAAEKIASKIAEVLPDDDPIRFGDKSLEQACSKDLSRLLAKRVAFHHSGLGFAERAAIIEPLAKAGQLRVIVATMGLAAGINFSVRSVFVSETSYQDGPFQRNVSPDELLQMFGRAGRRGLDKVGYVITGDKSPRLMDAHPLELRRQNELDWPTLIRRMHFASESGDSPFLAARDLRDRLFSDQKIPLGFRPGLPTPPSTGATTNDGPLFGLKPTRKEIRNSKGTWETIRSGREGTTPLGEAVSFYRGRNRSAEGNSKLISSLLPERARLCRLDKKGSGSLKRYGLEIAVATEREDGQFSLTKLAGKLVQAGKQDRFSQDEVAALLPEFFQTEIAPAAYETVIQRGKNLYLTGHFRSVPIETYLDSLDRAIHEPEIRSVEIDSETHYTDEDSGEIREAAAGTAAHAWRSLRLIDDEGKPTARGVLFSLFQGGEGLAVAAALEDPNYPVDEMILHLANLRAGHRFELDSVPGADTIVDSIGSERLAAACRQAYGPVDHEGYQRLGLPVHYGEGAAEVIALMLEGSLHKLMAFSSHLEFGPGDVERAFIEWLSLLRHIHHAPDLEDDRWRELKQAASLELKRRDRRSPLANLPELPATVLQKPPQHGIRYARV